MISKYSNVYKENQKSIKSAILDFSEELMELKEQNESMTSAIYELKEAIVAKEVILKKA